MDIDVVLKLGGTSLGNGEKVEQAVRTIKSYPGRKIVVTSAPGKRYPGDVGVTDLLELLTKGGDEKYSYQNIPEVLRERFLDIAERFGVEEHFYTNARNRDFWYDHLPNLPIPDAVSQGDKFMGIILSHALGSVYIDPSHFICFDDDGIFDMEATRKCWAEVSKNIPDDIDTIVVPGFSGAKENGEVCNFTRGGSDITMVIMGVLANAKVCVKLTDVRGVYTADPRVVKGARVIGHTNYREVAELCYNNDHAVLHPDAMRILMGTDIPVRVRSVFDQANEGTLITETRPFLPGEVVGIAGRRGFVEIEIRKIGMRSQVGVVRSCLAVLEEMEISFEDMPGGMDYITIAVSETGLTENRKNELLRRLRAFADSAEIVPNLALICITGEGISGMPGVKANIYHTLMEYGIRERGGSGSGISYIVGVDEENFERAKRALHDTFFGYK